MKKLLLLLFSMLVSLSSYGEWKELGEDVVGDTFYIDTDSIKEHNGYVYWWYLTDFPKPYDDELSSYHGMISAKAYAQGDCGLTRYKVLSYIFYKQPMGEELLKTNNPSNPKWVYVPPESVGEKMLDYACNYVE